jgi:hypothetical protein
LYAYIELRNGFKVFIKQGLSAESSLLVGLRLVTMKTMKLHWLISLLTFILTISTLSVGVTQTYTPTSTPTTVSSTRDKWLQPFASNSIWNMPIGSNATYVSAGLQAGGFTGVDVNLLYKVPTGSPERPIYNPYSWAHRAQGTKVADPNRRKTIPKYGSSRGG